MWGTKKAYSEITIPFTFKLLMEKNIKSDFHGTEIEDEQILEMIEFNSTGEIVK